MVGPCAGDPAWYVIVLELGMDETDLTKLQFDVYMTRDGPWNPEHGEIEIPDDWEFLPSGDAFVTRRV